MQPYFFPYLGYFHLINLVDKWIVFDTVQYLRHSWGNRNRILHPNSGWQYITVPLVKHTRGTPIKEIITSEKTDWRSRIIRQLDHYKNEALNFKETIQLVEDCLFVDEIYLSRLNTSIIDELCKRLDITFNHCFLSEMNIEIGPIENPGDWALIISKSLGADEYINSPGGAHLFDRRKFEQAGIKITIQDYQNVEYQCGSYEYIPALSIIDVLMWNPIDKIKKHLDCTFS